MLSENDRNYLGSIGFTPSDFPQIERAKRRTKYTISDRNGFRKARMAEVESILGRKLYLSGLARSAFHWSACRISPDGIIVYFDSSCLFR